MSEPRTYRIQQLGRPDGKGLQRNEDVSSLDDLVTHHPNANRHAQMVDGSIEAAEQMSRRSHAVMSGDLEEIIDARVDKYSRLGRDQALLVKDFILEDPAPPPGRSARAVDVPSPVSGYVSKIVLTGGLVELTDKPDGEVIVRVRHLRDISISVGDRIEYGDSLGTQHNVGLNVPAGSSIHVHLEIDTRHYRQFARYMDDLASGRLPVQDEHRRSSTPGASLPDGTFRLGESHPRIRDLQGVMAKEGYRAAGGGELDRDGVYRLGMQGALLDFQRDHGVRQTGDIDPATLQFAPPARSRLRDLPDHFQPGLPLPRLPHWRSAPGHPDHPDHRPHLPSEPEPRINQRADRASDMPQALDRLARALQSGDEPSLSRACADIARMPQLDTLLRDLHARLDAPQSAYASPLAQDDPSRAQPALALS